VANPLTRAWSYITSPHPSVQKKFYPADPAQNWEQINSLVYTFRRDGDAYGRSGDGNSGVFACLMALSLGSIEAPLTVFRKDADGKKEPDRNNPLQAFLDDPNPTLPTSQGVFDPLELEFWKTWAKHCNGNAYFLKVRAGSSTTGNVVQLWPVSPTLIRPWTEKGSSQFIDYYRYEVKPGVYEQVPVENVIHFRLGVDDRDPRLGLSPLARLVREISSDAEAMRFQDQLLGNYGIPGLVVEVPADTDMTNEQAEQLKEGVGQAFNTENRGKVGVLRGGAQMKQFGLPPAQLDLTALHNIPEARICAVMGVHPAVAMLSVGLAQTANYASLRAVYEAFTERKLVPNWRMDQAKWQKWLTPDFTSDPNISIEYDLSDVRALQEDQDALYARLDNAVKTGWLLPDEARSEAGFPPMADGLGMQPIAKPAAPPSEQIGSEQTGRTSQTPKTPVSATQGGKAFPLDTWTEDLQSVIEDAVPMFTEQLERYQNGVKRRVKRSLISRG